SGRPRTRPGSATGPWSPWCPGRPSCPCRPPDHAPCGSGPWWTRAPGAGDAASLVYLLHLDKVGDLEDHAEDLGTVLLDHGIPDPLEPEDPDRGPLRAGPADQGPLLGDLETGCHADCSFALPAPAPTAAAALCLATVTGDISARSRPRASATSWGRRSCFRPATVAWTMLIGLEDPSDLERTSETPAASSTARTGPPAMTPGPGEAGLSRTRPAPSAPRTSCGMVVPIIGTGKKFFLAVSTPFWMAEGTSLALP